MSVNIEMNMKGADGVYEALYPRTLGALVEGKVSSATNADTAVSAQTSESAINATNATTATSAGKLTTARSLRVSLSSTSSQSFNGSANATSIGVNGTLGVSNGGTGVTSYSSLASQISSYLSSSGAKIECGSYSPNGNSITLTSSSINNIKFAMVLNPCTTNNKEGMNIIWAIGLMIGEYTGSYNYVGIGICGSEYKSNTGSITMIADSAMRLTSKTTVILSTTAGTCGRYIVTSTASSYLSKYLLAGD